MPDELESKAAEMLISLTQSLAEGPESLIGLYATLLLNAKDNPDAVKQVNEVAMKFISKIPEMTRVLSDSTKVLETYLSYKISKRQEDATIRQEAMTKTIIRQNRILSYSTLFLAVANIVLVLVTVLLRR